MLELNERGKEVQRIMDNLGNVGWKTWYGKTAKEMAEEILQEALHKVSVD